MDFRVPARCHIPLNPGQRLLKQQKGTAGDAVFTVGLECAMLVVQGSCLSSPSMGFCEVHQEVETARKNLAIYLDPLVAFVSRAYRHWACHNLEEAAQS